MSKDYWFTSDTHFGHNNIIKYAGRPFSSVEEMDETLVERWNSVVKPGDIVYHLGDVFFGSQEGFKKLWPRLNGSKRLVVGNHDDIIFLSSGGFFKKVMMWRVWNDRPLIFSHVPLHPSTIMERGFPEEATNVHGHTHQNGSPEGNYRSVCVELTNYTPVNLEELAC
jgi:calcineurin-like phosphoesterase family protein